MSPVFRSFTAFDETEREAAETDPPMVHLQMGRTIEC